MSIPDDVIKVVHLIICAYCSAVPSDNHIFISMDEWLSHREKNPFHVKLNHAMSVTFNGNEQVKVFR